MKVSVKKEISIVLSLHSKRLGRERDGDFFESVMAHDLSLSKFRAFNGSGPLSNRSSKGANLLLFMNLFLSLDRSTIQINRQLNFRHKFRHMHSKMLKGWSMGLSFKFFWVFEFWFWVWVFCETPANFE